MNHQETMTDYLMAFIEGLKNSGVEQAVISPGSRSTPLALLLHRETAIQTFVDVDERSAAFFARVYCPNLLMGFSTEDEVRDIQPEEKPKETICL